MPGRLGLIEWKSPRQRAIIPLDDRFQIGKRLRKKLESNHFSVTFNHAFCDVLNGCVEPSRNRGTTWVSPVLLDAYKKLHQMGYAHSVEVWLEDRLVGGEFGIAIGGFYSGESAFAREDYASRVAIAHLALRLRANGFQLFDSQVLNQLAREFGAFTVIKEEYEMLLKNALSVEANFVRTPSIQDRALEVSE